MYPTLLISVAAKKLAIYSNNPIGILSVGKRVA